MAYVMFIFITSLVIVTMSYSEAKFPYWGMGGDLERQSCPSPASCPSGAPTCNSQSCSSGQKCCIDIPAERVCCLATASPAPQCLTPDATCDLGGGVNQPCTKPEECYLDERCCHVGDIAIACCVKAGTRPPPGKL